MRPRVFAAEDQSGKSTQNPGLFASMRPRVFAAEDFGYNPAVCPSGHCFNEAAGIRRGRRRMQTIVGRGETASMRPRVFAAEDRAVRGSGVPRPSGFNEAAGIRRGRRGYRVRC